MKCFRTILAAFLAILMVAGAPISAMAAQWDAYTGDDVSTAFKNDTDDQVTINLKDNITMNSELEAKEGQTYTIKGSDGENNYSISDVEVSGKGEVVIEADVKNDGNNTALTTAEEVSVTVTGDITSSGNGVIANDDSSITVTGNITAEDFAVVSDDNANVSVTGDVSAETYDTVTTYGNSEVTIVGNVTSGEYGSSGVVAYENSKVEVTGDVTSELSSAVFAYEESTVTVTGNVSSTVYDGIHASDSADVTVTGNIDAGFYGISAEGDDVSVTVTGDINAGNIGIIAEGNSVVHVTGDVQSGSYNEGELTEEDMQDPHAYSDGFAGIEASENANVTVDGNVTAGNAMGTFGSAGSGIEASNQATVTVTGNVTGGNVSANPDTASLSGIYSTAGHGIEASGSATVSVGGNVTGGSTNGQSGIGGSGVHATGSASVAVAGNVQGGNSTAANGFGGHGIYAESDNTITVGDITAGDVTGVTDFGSNVTGGDATGANGVGGDGIHLVAGLTSGLATGSISVENVVTGGNSDEGNTSSSLYFESYSPNRKPYFADVHVWELSDENGDIVGTDSSQKTAQELAEENVSYYIRYTQPEEGTISVDTQEAKQGDTVTVTGDGAFEFTYSPYATDEPAEVGDGKYTLSAPLGGAVLIQASPAAEEPEAPSGEAPAIPEPPSDSRPVPPANAVTPQTGDRSNVALCVMFFVFSFLGLTALTFRKHTAV